MTIASPTIHRDSIICGLRPVYSWPFDACADGPFFHLCGRISTAEHRYVFVATALLPNLDQ
jgi:hypothetical protein